MNIIGICGTHGTGKSTILQGIKNQGFKVNEAQISRAVQKTLGWETLGEAEKSVQNMWDLQEAILATMYDRDHTILKSDRLTAVERTPADVWAYTEMWCTYHGIDVKRDAQAVNFKARCRSMAEKYSKYVIVQPHDTVLFAPDPNRATLMSRKFVELAIARFIEGGGYSSYVMRSPDRKERVTEMMAQMIIEKARLGL
jgi:predicted ATPase